MEKRYIIKGRAHEIIQQKLRQDLFRFRIRELKRKAKRREKSLMDDFVDSLLARRARSTLSFLRIVVVGGNVRVDTSETPARNGLC